MQSRIWGQNFWLVLHCIGLNYPVTPTLEQKKHYLQFFQSLQWVLPCKSCRESYARFITRGKTKLCLLTMTSRESVARWVYDLHNAVSKRIGKRSTLTFEGSCKKYEQFRASSCNKHTCDTDESSQRKRAVILVMDDKTYKRLGFRSSLQVI